MDLGMIGDWVHKLNLAVRAILTLNSVPQIPVTPRMCCCEDLRKGDPFSLMKTLQILLLLVFLVVINLFSSRRQTQCWTKRTSLFRLLRPPLSSASATRWKSQSEAQAAAFLKLSAPSCNNSRQRPLPSLTTSMSTHLTPGTPKAGGAVVMSSPSPTRSKVVHCNWSRSGFPPKASITSKAKVWKLWSWDAPAVCLAGT